MAGRPWFAPRKYGLGFTPVSWQGWLLTGAYAAVLVVTGLTLAESQHWIFWTVVAVATAAYLLVASLTRGAR